MKESQEYLNGYLFHAVVHGTSNDVENLMSRGADFNSRNLQGQTPLHVAALYGYAEKANILISKSNGYYCLDENFDSPLHIACKRGDYETFRAIINNVHHETLGAQNKYGQTALHYACTINGSFENSSFEIISDIAKTGVNIDTRDKDGKTPLQILFSYDKKSSALLLISYGADVKNLHENLRANNELDSITPHRAAAQGGFTDRMLELLRDKPSSLPEDAPKELAALAQQHNQHNTASAIRSFMASQAIEAMLSKSKNNLVPQ